MSRTTDDILAQILRVLPPRYAAYSAVLGGGAAQLALVDATAEDMAEATTIGGAEGVWLRLRARDHGLAASADETDESLRTRIRSIEAAVTRPAILAAVNELLAEYESGGAEMIEPWDDGFADVDAWADSTILSDLHNFFVLVVPLIAALSDGDTFADIDFADGESYAGDGVESPVYAAIIALVERLRAAGIRWRLHITE